MVDDLEIEPLDAPDPVDRLPCSRCGHSLAAHDAALDLRCYAADCKCQQFEYPADAEKILESLAYKSPIQSTFTRDPDCRDCDRGVIRKAVGNGYSAYGTCPRCAAYSRSRRG